nr:hypothetical protein [Escherichia coli]
MKGFSQSSCHGEVLRYQQTGHLAVQLETRAAWAAAADVWFRAARLAPDPRWRQFARQRAQRCHHRERV